jgi:hypothetical protein
MKVNNPFYSQNIEWADEPGSAKPADIKCGSYFERDFLVYVYVCMYVLLNAHNKPSSIVQVRFLENDILGTITLDKLNTLQVEWCM